MKTRVGPISNSLIMICASALYPPPENLKADNPLEDIIDMLSGVKKMLEEKEKETEKEQEIDDVDVD
jgi:hypothetical protein